MVRRPSMCPIDRQQPASLLLSALVAENTDR